MSRLQTGVFSGSFNPIHVGHLALANYLCTYEGMDEVWFMVSPHNPLKAEAELWPDDLRLKLVELAIEGYPSFKASDFEFHLPRPSFSIYTLDQLKEKFPEREFYLIIGSDNWAHFHRWYRWEEILQRHRLVVYPRPGFPIEEHRLPDSVRVVNSPVFDISSTFIRTALAEGKDVRYFLHPEVWRYIQNHPMDPLL